MKNLYLLIVSFVSFFVLTGNAQVAIPVKITQPIDTIIKTCSNNHFVAKFKVASSQKVSIKAYLGNTLFNSCGSTPIAQGLYIDSVQLTSTGTTTYIDSAITTNVASGIWSATIKASNTSNDSCILSYIIHLDCSLIPDTSITKNISLYQVWTDPTNVNSYSIVGGQHDTLQNGNIKYPYINDQTSLPATAGYLEYIDLPFTYKNSGSADADMVFNFTMSNSNYCGAFDSIKFSYKVDSIGTPHTLVLGNNVHINLPHGDTLFIIQKVRVVGCLSCDTSTTHQAVFQWHCFNSTSAVDTVFCTKCQNEYTTRYEIHDKVNSGLYLLQLNPASIRNNDLSCANDTANLVPYEYKIYNNSDAAIDTAIIDLGSSESPFLTLIPNSTIHIDSTKCINCHIVSITSSTSSETYCHTLITAPLYEIKIVVKNFAKGDTIGLKFKTFRCVDENDSLLNQYKFYDSWSFQNSHALGKCNTALHPDNINTLHYLEIDSNKPTEVPAISVYGINKNILSAIALHIDHISYISDLSVPHNQTFGDSASFEVQMLGFYGSFDEQSFGCTDSFLTCNLKGYLRVTVDCDSGLRVQFPLADAYFRYFDANGTSQRLHPLYFNSTKDTNNLCVAGKYYFYFNLSDTNFRSIINNGFFDYELQSCCGGQNGKRFYNVSFHTQLNPNGNCASLDFTNPNLNWTTPPNCITSGSPSICNSWLPLSSISGGITIHCPGCVTPGIVISSYSMERTSFGLEDSNDDGKADDGLIPITKTSSWYAAHSANLNTHFSGLADSLEDHLVAYFAAGDPTSSGYSYVQMLANGAQLPYLQLSRKIPSGMDTMKVMPDSFVVYIDTPDVAIPNCKDCIEFGVGNGFRTQKVLYVGNNNLSKFLTTNGTPEYYLYTFEAKDSSGIKVGNLFDASVSSFNDSLSPFRGFFETQQYRIKVFYSTCGNFVTSNGNTQVGSDDVRKRVTINNYMWLSGTPKIDNIFSTGLHNPANISELHAALYSIPPDTTHPAIDTTFASKFYFNCENFDGIHFFFAHDARNETTISSGSGCTKIINAIANFSVADGIVNAYPYEYRPGSLVPDTFKIIVPPHYKIDSAFVRTTVDINNVDSTGKWIKFHPAQTTGIVTVPASSLPVMHCLRQSNNTNDTLLYFGSRRTYEVLNFYISPSSCDSTKFIENDSTAIIHFGIANNSCTPHTTCTNGYDYTNLLALSTPVTYQVRPNDSIVFNHYLNNVTTSQFCLPITISNVDITDSGITAAPYFFIALPDSNAFPYLTNWKYIEGNTTYLPNAQIIRIDSLLTVNTPRTGSLCAQFKNCFTTDSLKVLLKYGWNCTGFPTSLAQLNTVCGIKKDTLTIKNQNRSIYISNQCYSTSDTLCDPFSINTCFTSQGTGDVTPRSFSLSNLQGLIVNSLTLNNDFNCNGAGTSVLLHLDSLTHSYTVTSANMNTVGYSNGVLANSNTVCVSASYTATCGIKKLKLPNIFFKGVGYCGDSIAISNSVQFFRTPHTFINDSITIVSSLCDSCFTIRKTASKDSIFVNDTITYKIIVCGSNQSWTFAYFYEHLPSDFTPISSIPSSLNIPDFGCDTVLIKGYFNHYGSCPDTSYKNVALIEVIPLNKYFRDSVCVRVVPQCVTPNTIMINRSVTDTIKVSTLGVYSYDDTLLYIQGTLILDHDLRFNNSHVYMAAGAKIIVNDEILLEINNSVLEGCDTMWQGIRLVAGAKIKVYNNSFINDADVAITSGQKSLITADKASLLNNVRGIYYPSVSSPYLSSGKLKVRETKFGLYAANLKNYYSGQITHGKLPYSGIELNGVPYSISIGDTGALAANYFYRMYTGIITKRSTALISHCTFHSIRNDYFYSNSAEYKGVYGGSAIFGWGDATTGRANKINVNSSTFGSVVIDSSDVGIYTTYSYLTAGYITMNNMRAGIQSNQCIHSLSSLVIGCNITARLFGIDWKDNSGSKFMVAEENRITITGLNSTGAGINLHESGIKATSNYFIYSDNEIHMVGGKFGIRASNVYAPVITTNVVTLLNNTAVSAAYGISIESCDSAIVDENYVSGQSVSDTSRKAYYTFTSSRSIISCNISDSTGFGFYFGSLNMKTKLIGNIIHNHFDGLRLNSSAVIDTQSFTGNRWVGTYGSTFGAVNFNDSSTNKLKQSLFVYDPSLSSAFIPTIPLNNSNIYGINDNGWFYNLPNGHTYTCGSPSNSPILLDDGGSQTLRLLIASDSAITSDYINESKSIAQEYLYDELRTDSTLVFGNTIYQDFMANNQNLQYLYDTRDELRAAGQLDSVTNAIIENSHFLIQDAQDSLSALDELESLNPTIDFAQVRDALEQVINNLNENITTALADQEPVSIEHLNLASLINGQVDPIELPEYNTRFIDQVDIKFELYGVDSIYQYFGGIFDVANQCPFQGGQAVTRARFFMSYLNDSIVYDDEQACINAGFYRIKNKLKSTNFDFKIIPNPANETAEIVFNNVIDEKLHLQITSVDGQTVVNNNLKMTGTKIILNSKILAPGTYQVQIQSGSNSLVTHKLIVIR